MFLELEVGDHPLVARHVLAHQGERHRDRRMAGQRRFDLAQLDAEAADLDLEVETAEVFELAVRPPADPVAGLVHPFAPDWPEKGSGT